MFYMNYTEKNKPKVPTIQTIKEILQNLQQILLLEQEDNLTLALPLIGCGIGGLEKSEVVLEYKNFFLCQKMRIKSAMLWFMATIRVTLS